MYHDVRGSVVFLCSLPARLLRHPTGRCFLFLQVPCESHASDILSLMPFVLHTLPRPHRMLRRCDGSLSHCWLHSESEHSELHICSCAAAHSLRYFGCRSLAVALSPDISVWYPLLYEARY